MVVPFGGFPFFLCKWDSLLMRVSIPKSKSLDTKTGHDELKRGAGFNIIGIMLRCYHWNMSLGVVLIKSCKVVKAFFPP